MVACLCEGVEWGGNDKGRGVGGSDGKGGAME